MKIHQEKKFLFSIVMAVYNVEAYLDEAIKSVINQTLNFERHVQLILVNDGSTDNSADLCREYSEKFPENIVFVNKSNGGVGSARNVGLQHVKGKYVNFLDADDTLSRNALENVVQFFEKRYDEIDVVAIPIVNSKGKHLINKVLKTEEVVELNNNIKYIQYSISNTFVKHQVLINNKFDESLKYDEGVELINKIILNKKLGIISKASYFYRQRSGQLTAEALSNQDGFICTIRLCNSLIEFYKKNHQFCPPYIQNVMLFAIYNKLKIQELDDTVQLDVTQFNKALNNILQNIDDAVIMSLHANIHLKMYIFNLKYKVIPAKKVFFKNDVHFYFKNYLMNALKNQYISLELLNTSKDTVEIEGHVGTVFHKNDIQLSVEVNGQIVPAVLVDRSMNDIKSLGNTAKEFLGGKFILPADFYGLDEGELKFFASIDGTKVQLNIGVGPLFPISDEFKNSYFVNGNYILTLTKKSILVRKKSRKQFFVNEMRFLREVWKTKKEGARKAVFARLCYFFYKKINAKSRIWIFMDRQDKANDNAEHLFKYCVKQSDKIKKYFVIDKGVDDFDKLRRVGNTVVRGSYKHKILHLLSEKVISSHADLWVTNPFFDMKKYYKDLYKFDFVFLQHGITKDDMSGWLHKYKQNIKYFVTAAKPEYESIINGKYGYNAGEVILTGFPRFDNLTNHDKKQILIAPTWRKQYVRDVNQMTGVRPYSDKFKYTDYFVYYNQLVNDSQFIQAAKEKGYKIIFFPHPNIHQQLSDFDRNEDVVFADIQSDYQKLFSESSLLITDYSSVFFDFAYLKKPVVYFHFDPPQYIKGYFDYNTMGFGDIAYDYNQLISIIMELISKDCTMDEKYVERVQNFYEFTDKSNCRRVYQTLI